MGGHLFLILITFALSFIRWGMLFPLVPLLARDLGASPSMIGLIVGSFSVVSFFLSVPIGGITDRVGIKRILVFAVCCNIVSSLLLVYGNHILILIASQVAGGLGFQLHIVSSQTFIASIDSPLRRESGFGHLSFSASIGQTLGPVLGGIIADHFGYHGAFLASLMVSASGLIILGLRKPHGSHTPHRYSLRQDLRQATTLLSNSRMIAVLAFTFAVIFSITLRMSFLPVLLIRRGLSEAGAGLLISIFAGTSAVVRFFTGRILQRFSRRAILAFITLTISGTVGLIPMLQSVFAVTLALGIFGLGFGLCQPLSMVMVADLADPGHTGLSMGIRFTAITLANITGPVFLGILVGGFGLNAAFYASALFVLVISVFILSWKTELLPGRRQEGH